MDIRRIIQIKVILGVGFTDRVTVMVADLIVQRQTAGLIHIPVRDRCRTHARCRAFAHVDRQLRRVRITCDVNAERRRRSGGITSRRFRRRRRDCQVEVIAAVGRRRDRQTFELIHRQGDRSVVIHRPGGEFRTGGDAGDRDRCPLSPALTSSR